MTRVSTTQRPRSNGLPDRRRSAAVPVAAVGLVVVVIAVALIVALVAGGGGGGDDRATGTDGDTATEVTTAASDDSSALPRYDDTETDDPAIGMTLPTLTGTDVDDEPMTVAADGRPKLVVFLAHWCPHCQAEVPVIQDWVDGGGLPEGVDLVAVATAIDERRPNYPAEAWLARERWSSPVLYDRGDSAPELSGLAAFPYFVVTDGDGEVLARATGELSDTQLDEMAALAASGA